MVVFGNNTASDISKFSKYHSPLCGSWNLENFEILQDSISAKYHVQVMLFFVYNRSTRDLYFVTVRKISAGVCIRFFSRPNIQPRFVFLFTDLTANFCISSLDISGNLAAIFLKEKT